MEKDLPLELDRETLLQLAPEQLVNIIIKQAIATEKLNRRILELEQEVQKLKVSRDLDSKTSSSATIWGYPQKIRKQTRAGRWRQPDSKAETRRTTRASGKNS